MTIVFTERLRLEPVDDALADDLRLVHQDPDVAMWSGGGWTWQEARDVAAEMARSWRDHGVGKWLAYDRGTGALVGRGGPAMTTALGGLHAEIGWAVRRPYQRLGYATEIGRAALRLVDDVLGASEVFAFTEVHNHRSRAVMERLGMSYRGEIRHPGLVEGVDGIVPDAPFALYVVARGRT